MKPSRHMPRCLREAWAGRWPTFRERGQRVAWEQDLMAFADATLSPGIDLVCEAMGFDNRLEGADLLITGEGRIDASTAFNKAPVGVAKRAKRKGVPVIALAGSLGTGYQAVYEHGITSVVPIADRPMSFRESLGRTRELLCDAAERSIRLYLGRHVR